MHLPQKEFFTSNLMEWYGGYDRELPWKGEKDPYKIWLSEIILQQTRVEQGRPYYEKFVQNFPTVFDLANASEDVILKNWQGLGYYSRARNLRHTAKYIADHLGGNFPQNFKELLKLKGVGNYTAAAIASFAFNEPVAVVDGNVYRVLSRFFNITLPVDSVKGKSYFNALANELIDKKNPADYNQAIMDFGATVCLPKNPLCLSCPLASNCHGLNISKVSALPVKAKKLKKKQRYFNYLVLKKDNFIYLNQRNGKDIWKKLFDFPLIEDSKLMEVDELTNSDFWKKYSGNNSFRLVNISKPYEQVLTHQKITARFIEIEIKSELNSELNKVKMEDLYNFAFPKIIDCYLKDKTLTLSLL